MRSFGRRDGLGHDVGIELGVLARRVGFFAPLARYDGLVVTELHMDRMICKELV